ncbi:transcriptional regulator, LysR family [Methylocella silvestris BL2]|uniref:Transcriptional regulator, LysR family n=1 Tax=Methylocella silvestris (strain DSM 15510 / CIP 108128 / LMG 27833 / NCIMB 13906 / BL2) TaxID=395965 RepID=B8EQV7_METSB|nr:LysR family transcriptional regulator [Methylocella silvestris]ACK49378.1 transcriptional regulator, LysR family [Methylocella silvestris BL2]
MIEKLEFLLALARERNFSRAAEFCGVTQPTLSAGIKQLEETLGVLLVNRSSRFHGLTPDGERVLEWAKRIVADARAMRQEIRSPKKSLIGHLTLAVVPTALGMVQKLTVPFREKHPQVRFTILSQTSREILIMLDGLQIDAGLTYVDNEPLGHIRATPLYRERYRLLTSADQPLGDRASVTWKEVAKIPLCLLTPDMQNRRIIDRMLASSAPTDAPMLESNSMVVLAAHVRTGQWASIIPETFADILDQTQSLRSIPIVEPKEVQTIGLVLPRREPMPPLSRALLAEATRLAALEGVPA